MGVVIGPSDHRVPSAAQARLEDRLGSSANPEYGTLSTPAALELHIEELVLHGFPASDRFRIGDAVQRELVRLMTEQGLTGFAENPTSMERLDAGGFKVASNARPQAIGAQLAHSLHQQLSAAKAPGHNQDRTTRKR